MPEKQAMSGMRSEKCQLCLIYWQILLDQRRPVAGTDGQHGVVEIVVRVMQAGIAG